jgi:hypothetical protein
MNADQQSATVEREVLHHRQIDMRGYRRSDGLFEVEGRVTDRKPFDFVPASSERTILAHQPIHDMGVRLVFDRSMLVVEVHTFTDASPYEICPAGGAALQEMNGVRIGPGWGSEVRRKLAGSESCTHLMELLLPMATAAIQTMSPINADKADRTDANGRPWQIDACYAYSAERALVKERWPQFHRIPAKSS